MSMYLQLTDRTNLEFKRVSTQSLTVVEAEYESSLKLSGILILKRGESETAFISPEKGYKKSRFFLIPVLLFHIQIKQNISSYTIQLVSIPFLNSDFPHFSLLVLTSLIN